MSTMFDIDELFTVFDAKPTEAKIEDIDLQLFSRKRPNDSVKDKPQKKFKEGNILEESSPLENLPQIQVKQLETPDGCTHEVVLPKSMTFTPLSIDPLSKPAKEYPFTLDPFQKEAVVCIENNQSVLVSAHTSAGKTVVAEYAVALSLKRKQRVIYTTPIKALSNQKYREFQDEFKDVGLITGDMTINPNASCLIMTTEILRSMLFRGSEVIREVAWVIFDEIHYMRNKERGVVWEESIIMLPDDVHYVFLSATIPNARQFAEWIAHLHKQPCHVVYTEYRPTPLQHYVYPAGGDGIHLIVDEHGSFREDNFNNVMLALKDGENSSSSSSSSANKNQKGRKGGYGKGESSCFKIVKMIQDIKFTPVIIFSFSKRDCEAYADQLLKLDFISDEEKELVSQVYENAVMTLSEEDRKLPQVEEIRKYLMKGIGIHHSGLLPIVKELTEILFSENLVKALCATETFAMGLNMPARTVLFTSTRKFDGVDFRSVSSGEYIQMSGRAGRRGLDDKGIVIMMIDEKMTPANVKQIVMGQSDPLNSAYHITYNMILNTLRVEGINPEFMLEKSFFHFQNYPAVRTLYEKLKKAEEDFASVTFDNADELALYYALKKKLEAKCRTVLSTMQKPQYILPSLVPGRLVKVEFNGMDFGWSAVVNAPKKKAGELKTQEGHYVVDVLLNVEKCSVKHGCYDDLKPCPSDIKGEAQIVPVPLSALTSFSKVRSDYLKKINRSGSRSDGLGIVQKILSNFKDGPPPLDPIEDIGIKDKECLEAIGEMKKLQDMIKSLMINKDEKMMTSFTQYEARQKVYEEIQSLKAEYRQRKSMLQMEELKRKKRVLRRMKYVDASDVVQLKGRVACEISCADELVVTELLFNGVFNKLATEELCAVLSCFVFQEKSEMSKLTENLSGHHRLILDTARQVLEVSKEVGLEMNDDEYMDSFKPHMMEVVHAWSKGGSFAKICEMTVIHEGSIVRCIKRLEECLRQIYQAARAMGNADLEIKSSTGRRLIYKDIVFSRGLCI